MARTTMRSTEANRAAIYARVSDKSQAEEDKTSISEQISDMGAYCERSGLTIVARYQEVGRGWSEKLSEFQRMLSDARTVTTEEGTRIYAQPEETWIKVAVPPLVDEATWERAQQLKKERLAVSKRNTKVSYRLQHLLRCTECGLRFRSKAKWHSTNRHDGKVTGTRRPHSCGTTTATVSAGACAAGSAPTSGLSGWRTWSGAR